MITDKIDYKSAYESVLIANDMLRKENKELHNKIDKAIEFIKQAQYDDELKSYVYGLNATGTRKLLEILKDSDVDEKTI